MTDLQRKLLDLLKLVDKLCQENGVEYYLIGGTLIGAVRHKGFVPWDDDADIIMTRDHWERFLKCTEGKLPPDIYLDVQCGKAQLRSTVNHTINHLADKNSTQIYRYDLTNPKQTGVIIDIVIMDPLPDMDEDKRIYIESMMDYAEFAVLPYHYLIRIGKAERFRKYWKWSRIVGRERVLEWLRKKAFCYSEEQSQLYVQRFAGSPHFWPKQVFGKPKYVPFEDVLLPIPERAEDCLCIGFDDDWMYIPRAGVTKSTHTFCVSNLTIPGEVIGEDFERHVNRKALLRTYVKRKKLQVAQTENKFRAALDAYRFIEAKIRLVYEKKRRQADFRAMLEQKDYAALEAYFEEYIHIQCRNFFIGSSALEGWINWYRKCNPFLIDIGDDALFAVLSLLMYRQKLAWAGKLLKARKAVERPFTEELADMERLYQAIKKTTGAYDCGEDAQCRALLTEYLPVYPENPFLWKLDLKLRIREGLSGDAFLEAAEEGLALFPGDAELRYFEAAAYLELGQEEAALERIRALTPETNHGLVLLQLRERLEQLMRQQPERRDLCELWLEIRKQMGEEELPELTALFPEPEEEPDEGAEPAVPPEPAAAVFKPAAVQNLDPLNAVQEKRFQLLCEVRQICEEEGIRYYLFGRGLLQASRNGRYTDRNGELVVVMKPEGCRKFIAAVRQRGRPDRYLDSMEESPGFHRFCLRYGDSGTLDFFANQCGSTAHCGIFLTIEILRVASKSKLRNQFDQMLEVGWESRNTMKWSTPKRWVSYAFVSTLCFVAGEQRVGRWLFRRFLKSPPKRSDGQFYLKPFWGKRTYYPAYWFQYVRTVQLEGEQFTTMKPHTLYLCRQFGAKWKTKKLPQTKVQEEFRIVDAGIGTDEYLAYLQKCGIDRVAIWKHRQKTNRNYARVVTMGSQTGRYWDIMCMCGERYRLLEKYRPMKLYILELFRSENISQLMKVLKDYYDTAVFYSKKDLGLCFDKRIFEILEYCLRVKGKGKQARRLRSLIAPQDWQPIEWNSENKLEAEGMRRALPEDVPAILTYLKRGIENCVYMYIDIAKYGLENPNMKVWLDSDKNGIRFVAMKYHGSISLYTSAKTWDIDSVVKLIEEEQVLTLNMSKVIADQLYGRCAEQYDITYGSVFRFTAYHDIAFDGVIEPASPADAMEIAKLVATDESIGSYYELNDLADQIAERMETGMGRSFVIRDAGEIIAHIGSYAECNKIATTNGLIVRSDCRSNVYGAALERHLLLTLLEEGFQVYTFVTKRMRKKLLTAMGNRCVGEYARMDRKGQQDG